MGCHGMTRKNTLYDESARVPLIVSWPGVIQQGQIADQTLVSGLDIMPTLCDYAGAVIPTGAGTKDTIKGISLRASLEHGEMPGRSFIAVEVASNLGQMIRSSRFKYITHQDDASEMLFDMHADPGETLNLAQDRAFAPTLEQHRAMLRDWIDNLDIAPNVPAQNRWFN
jgi:arylsulfatase A-like enzyme